MCSGDVTKTRYVILDFDMVSEIITFERKGRLGKGKHQNLGAKVCRYEEKLNVSSVR